MPEWDILLQEGPGSQGRGKTTVIKLGPTIEIPHHQSGNSSPGGSNLTVTADGDFFAPSPKAHGS